MFEVEEVEPVRVVLSCRDEKTFGEVWNLHHRKPSSDEVAPEIDKSEASRMENRGGSDLSPLELLRQSNQKGMLCKWT